MNKRVLREIVGNRDGWVCWLCGLPVARELSSESRIGATLDHVLAKSRGGSFAFDNVRIAHAKCNHLRRNRLGPGRPKSTYARMVKKRVIAHERKLRRRPYLRAPATR